MLQPLGNPFKCSKEVLCLQPMIPPKRFDIFPPDWGILDGLDAFRFFFKQQRHIHTFIQYIQTYIHRYMCVFSSHSFWTSSSLDVPAGVTQEEGHTGFLIHLLSAVRALIFLARRIQPFLSLVDREVEFCVLTI